MSTPRNVYALLVGIDDYPAPVPPLHGCRNDIAAIASLLDKRVAGTGDTLHLQTLLDEEATRVAVIAGFREHLGRAKAGDVALFYYSGHGSQEGAPKEFWHLEPDRLDETLVLWDSRLHGQWDLADKELAALLTEVAATEPHILIVLDCCHSGSGTRAPLEDGIGSRRAPTDTRERPLSSFLFDPSHLDDFVRTADPDRAALGDSGWSKTRATHVLLSGCRSNETSKEILHDGSPRGAMSVALESALEKSGDALTYREIHRQVRATVNRTVRQQSPQLETSTASDLDQPFLGGAVTAVPAWFAVTREGTAWTMDGGLVHGIPAPLGEEITRVAITDPAGNHIGTANVTQVRAGDSNLSVTTGELDPTRSYRATVTSSPLPPLLVRITGTAADEGETATGGADALRTALATRQEHGPALVREAGTGDDPQIEVLVDPGHFAITRSGSDRALWPRPKTAAEAVAILERVAAWTTALELRNPASKLPRDAVTVRLDAQPDPGQTLPIDVDGGYRLEYLTDDRSRPRGYTLTLTNTTKRTLWVSLLDLTDTFGIYADALESGSQQLEPGESRPVELTAVVPDELWEQGITEVTDVLKVIVSTEEFDPRPMEQEDLEVTAPATRSAPPSGWTAAQQPPTSTLDRLLRRVGTRRAKPQASGEAAADWFTKDLTVVSVRPRPGVATNSDEPTLLGAGVVVQPHPSLKATLQLTTADDATRDLAAAPVPEFLQGEGMTPFTLTTTRDGAHGADALLLHLDPASPADSVTSTEPLIITVSQPLAPGEHLLPFAWDGEFYIPLGHAHPSAAGDGTDIILERLTQPVVTTRSLGGSIRILFRKLIGKALGLPPAYPVLRLATVGDDGTVNYTGDPDAVRAAVTAADSVLLYVHGIIGDTQGMARSSRLTGKPHPIDSTYAVLTFDYENLHTPIEENAASLGAMLAAVGLNGHHGKRLDIIAHSMGGLVSRHLIERIGGVDIHQLITLGTPNGGSQWANVQKWATAAITFAANGFIPVAWPITALAALLGGVEKVDTSLDQMEPGSDFLTQLRTAPDPHTTYHVLIGNRSLVEQAVDPTTDGRLARLLGRLTPTKVGSKIVDLIFFNQPNDLAVAVTSAESLPSDRDPAPLIRVIATDHISFFEDRTSLDVLSDILST